MELEQKLKMKLTEQAFKRVQSTKPNGKLCSISSCPHGVISKGLCNAHYIRTKKGKSLDAPLKPRNFKAKCKTCESLIGSKGGWGFCSKHYTQEKTKFLKREIVKFFGDKCQLCKQSFPDSVYDFHHLHGKDLEISGMLRNNSIKRICEELRKCILLCANCHREVHNEF